MCYKGLTTVHRCYGTSTQFVAACANNMTSGAATELPPAHPHNSTSDLLLTRHSLSSCAVCCQNSAAPSINVTQPIFSLGGCPFICRLSLGGPLIPDTKQPALYKIPVLLVGERVLLHLNCSIGGCGDLSIQPFVALPVSMAGQAAH